MMNERKIKLLGGMLMVISVLLALGWQTLAARAQTVPLAPVQPTIQQDATPAHDGGGDHHGNDGNKTYGIINSMPLTGLTGSWVISGVTYTADEATDFEPEHGGFAVGVCAGVITATAAPTVAVKIETESAYKCNSDDSGDDHGNPWHGPLIFGKIISLPVSSDLTGAWVVGSETFTVTTDTELVQENLPFTVGVFVMATFDEVDGQKIANKVVALFALDGDDDFHHGHHHHDGRAGRAFGPIDSLPEGLIGSWVIAGLNYSVTTETELKSSTAFTVGLNVKVEYFTNSAGERVATKIKQTGNHGGVGGPGIFKFVGWVSEKPSGFIGTWTIGEQPFVATAATRFDESKGLLTSTSYVEATYRIVGDERILIKLEAEVPPGAGDDDSVGTIEDNGLNNSLAAADVDVEVWRIGGVEYVVSPSTQIVGEEAQLQVGYTAVVNSYVDASGANAATRIEAVSLDNRVLLPLLVHQ